VHDLGKPYQTFATTDRARGAPGLRFARALTIFVRNQREIRGLHRFFANADVAVAPMYATFATPDLRSRPHPPISRYGVANVDVADVELCCAEVKIRSGG
jgi:hypothetical protein